MTYTCPFGERALVETVTGKVGCPLDDVPPFALFGGVGDDAWRWLQLEGREQCPFLGRYLPRLTGDPEFEAELVGLAGAEALAFGFEVYELFRRLYEEHAGPLAPSSRVLDFGCGWGRVIRFFIKHVAPKNLIGVDLQQRAVDACIRTNQWCRFQGCEALPPSGLEAGSFDLVYGFSVFSHLSEEAHERWLEEFERLLVPGGVLLLTTFRRELLESAASRSAEIARLFSPLDQWLSAYDRGQFCFRRQQAEAHPHFGYTFIPEPYVREHWTRRFVVRDCFDAPALDQSIIVCQKPE